MCTNKFYVKNPKKGFPDIQVPCGQCLACRINKQNDWTKRIMDECKMHKSNAFITLTYRDDCRPYVVKPDGTILWTIVKEDWTNFMKHLRQKCVRNYGKDYKLSFFTSAEYGTQSRQCHFHSIIFGLNANPTNQMLVKKVWKKGRTSTLPVFDGGADYCAKHQTKYDPAVDLKWQTPPYQVMSRRPAVGLRWIQSHPDSISYEDHELSYLKFSKRGMAWLPAPRYYIDKVFDVDTKKHLRNVQTGKSMVKLSYKLGLNDQAIRKYLEVNALQKEALISWRRYYGRDKFKRSKI
jgi:hypothetical protein